MPFLVLRKSLITILYHLQGKYWEAHSFKKTGPVFLCNDCKLTYQNPWKDSHEMNQRLDSKYLPLLFTTTIPAFTNWLLFIYVRRPEEFSLCSIDFLPHLLFINYAFLKVWNVKWVLWENSNFDTSCHKVGNF